MHRVALACALAALPAAALAQGLELAHQGRLLDADGAPLQGAATLVVSLHATQTGGAALWSATYAVDVDDGYFSVMLGEDDAGLDVADVIFARDGDTWAAVAVGGAELSRTRLAHVPAALVARAVDSGAAGATRVDPSGRLILRHTSETGCAVEGELVYDPSTGAVRVCTGSAYEGVSPRTVALIDGVRRWSDQTFAPDCDGYRHPDGAATYIGDTGSGLYRIDPGGTGAFDVFCDMETDGGGWTLLFNLASAETARRDWNDTAFWLGASASGAASTSLTADTRSEAYHRLTGATQLLLRVHDEGASDFGRVVWPVLPAFQSQTFLQWITGGNDRTVTGNNTVRTGSTGALYNQNRPDQPASGDLFLAYDGALMLNRTSGWASGTTQVRVASTFHNTNRGHTFAGLGGNHVHSGYGAAFESAPISAYCSLRSGYGGTANVTTNGQSSYAYASNCLGPAESTTFDWIQADFALFAR